jgi:hypothetical protein
MPGVIIGLMRASANNLGCKREGNIDCQSMFLLSVKNPPDIKKSYSAIGKYKRLSYEGKKMYI